MAFSNVAYDNAANKVAVASSGGIEFLVDLLNEHRSHAGVQQSCCGAISSVASGNGYNQALVAAAGGVKSIVDMLILHRIDADLQQTGCQALGILAKVAAGRRAGHQDQVVIQAGGIEAVVSALRNHASNADVQKWGCWALLQMAQAHASVPQRLQEHGAEKVVAAAMAARNAAPATKECGRELARLFQGNRHLWPQNLD